MPPAAGSPRGSVHARTWLALALGVLVLGALLRIVHLEADPAYPLWAGYVTDEGRWTEQARRLVLFHSATPDSSLGRLHLILAPLYQAVTVVPFAAFGPGLASARLVSAVSSILLLLAAFVLLRRHLTPAATVVVLLVLGLQPDLLFLGRVAIPEMAAMLFSFLAFGALVSAGGSGRKLLAAGLLTSVTLAFKATTAPLVPVFAVIALGVGHGDEGAGRWGRVGAYLGGVILPTVLVLPPFLVLGGDRLIGPLVRSWRELAGFVRLESPYPAVAGLVYGEVAASTGVFLLSAWLVAGLLLVLGRLPRGGARDVWVGSAVWAAGWFAVSAVLDYFPDRYVLHVLVPVALNLGAGVTILQRVGSARILAGLERLGGWRRRAVIAWLCLPLAVMLVPTVIAAARLAGVDLDRLRHHLALVVVVELLLTVAWLRRGRPDRVLPFLVALPLALAALRMLAVAAGLLGASFWSPAGTRDLVAWLGLMVFAVGGVSLTDRGASRAPLAATGLLVLVLAGTWLVRSVPDLLYPTYTIRDAGAAVEALATGEERVGTISAAGVMLGTRIPYVEDLRGRPLPELVVVALRRIHPAIAGRYRLERRLELELGENLVDGDRIDASVRIYRLAPPEPTRPFASSGPGG